MEMYESQREEESFTTKLINTAKNKPVFMAAMTSFVTICGYGAYKWRSRTIPAQLFLTQLRVTAQGTAVGILSLGMIYHMCKDMLGEEKPEQK